MRHPLGGPTALTIHERIRPAPKVSCRWCRQSDNTFLAPTNHGDLCGLRWGKCMAQYLRENQLRFAVGQLNDAPRHDNQRQRDQLREALDNAWAVWGHVPHSERTWLDTFEARWADAAPIDAPAEHHEVRVDAEEVALW